VRFDRSGRDLSVHAHLLETTAGFRTELGFLNRNYAPDTDGGHLRMNYRFWPEDSRLNSWGPTAFFTHIDDQSGLRIYSQFRPEMTWTFDGQTELSVAFDTVKERLRPVDFAALLDNRDYQQESWQVSFESQVSATIGYAATLRLGEAINLSPPTGSEPALADSTVAELELFWRPLDRLRVDNTFLHTELDARNGAGSIFSNEIFRSRWNYQFTKEWSLRFIIQQEDLKPGAPSLTSLQRDKNRNYDLLVRYVINPWSSLYVGYNSNASNFELVDTINGTELISTNGLRKDGEQFFVKFSYLLQP
jgi:hypothetical protein